MSEDAAKEKARKDEAKSEDAAKEKARKDEAKAECDEVLRLRNDGKDSLSGDENELDRTRIAKGLATRLGLPDGKGHEAGRSRSAGAPFAIYAPPRRPRQCVHEGHQVGRYVASRDRSGILDSVQCCVFSYLQKAL